MYLRSLACLLCFVCGFAAPVARAGISYDSALTWRTLHSAHFRVHFHDGEEWLAQRTVATAERVHTQLSPIFGWQTDEPVDIVLTDRQDVANGFANFFPAQRMTIAVTPPDEISGLEDHGGWLDTVLTHEYVHILHLDKAHGVPSTARYVFGRNPLLFPNALQPHWLIEGLATYYETDRERGIGRGQSSYFDMLMRMEVARGVKPIHQINQNIVTWPAGVVPYLYGVAFYNYIATQGGQARILQLTENYSSNLIPFMINSNSREVLGSELDELWPQFENYLRALYVPRLEAIRAAGVVAGVRTTQHGYTTGAARALPDDSVVYVRADGGNEPMLMRRYVDGRVKSLAAVHPPAHLSVHAQAGALLAQPELYRNANYFYDLYRVDLENGDMQRLTHGARYRYAAWSPDGTRILAVHNEGGKHALHLLDDTGRQLEVLWAGEQDVVFADPDWSPDDSSVALAVWRPQGGWNLERFWLRERRFELLTQDSAIEAQPQFAPDGRSLLFSSDHGGVYNLRRLDFVTGQVTTLSNVEGGAFFPTQARVDGPVYYTGYAEEGFNIYLLDVPVALPTPLSTPGPSAIVAKDDPLLEGLQVSDYSPYDGLRPRWWLPHIAIDSQHTELGVITSGWDPLLRHLYYADLAYDFKNDWFVGSFDYIYDRLYPTIKLHASRYYTQYLDTNSNPQTTTVSDYWLGEVVLPFLAYRRDYYLHTAAYTVRTADYWTAPGLMPLAETTDNVLGLAFVYNSTRHYPLSISRSHGMQVSLAAENSDILDGSSYTGAVYSFDGRVFLPIASEHVLAARLSVGWGTENPRPYVLGGSFSAGEAPLPLDTAVLASPFNQRDFAVRGYDSGLPGLTGRRMFAGSLEWRLPLQRIERGFMAPPMAIHQVSAAVFADFGAAWETDRSTNGVFTGAGIETNANVYLFYDMNLHLRLGYAYGFADGGGNHFYFELGSSF